MQILQIVQVLKLQLFRIVGPIGEGTRRPASRTNSKENSINNSSKIIGKGTFSLADNIENNKIVGRISW